MDVQKNCRHLSHEAHHDEKHPPFPWSTTSLLSIFLKYMPVIICNHSARSEIILPSCWSHQQRASWPGKQSIHWIQMPRTRRGTIIFISLGANSPSPFQHPDLFLQQYSITDLSTSHYFLWIFYSDQSASENPQKIPDPAGKDWECVSVIYSP